MHNTVNLFVRLPNGREDAFDDAMVWVDEVGGGGTKQRTYVAEEREDGTLLVSRVSMRMRCGRVETTDSTALAEYQAEGWSSVRRELWRAVNKSSE